MACFWCLLKVVAVEIASVALQSVEGTQTELQTTAGKNLQPVLLNSSLCANVVLKVSSAQDSATQSLNICHYFSSFWGFFKTGVLSVLLHSHKTETVKMNTNLKCYFCLFRQPTWWNIPQLGKYFMWRCLCCLDLSMNPNYLCNRSFRLCFFGWEQTKLHHVFRTDSGFVIWLCVEILFFFNKYSTKPLRTANAASQNSVYELNGCCASLTV